MCNRPLSVIHTVASLRKSAGGPTRTVTALCSELGRLGACVELVSQDIMQPTNDLNLLPPAEFVKTSLAHQLPYIGRVWSPLFRAMLRKRCEYGQTMLIHDHGVWLSTNHSAVVVARQLGIPLIISLRGMLEPWAMNHKAWKKRFAWNLYQRRDLESAVVLHATAEQEAESFRQLGLRPPIAIIPNGTDLPEWRDLAYPKGTPRKMLFLSRIHQKKGLLELVRAWQIIKPTGWKMVIAGPDEGGHQKIVEAAIQKAGLQNDFEFIGPVYGDEKEALYRSADVFVLPTFSENFGLVVTEALACGVPVITTKGTPWQGLHTHRCGWWIDIGVEPLAAALREAMSLPPTTSRDMGRRGRAYVEENFGWPSIAQQMLSVYRWVLGQGERPDCVIRA